MPARLQISSRRPHASLSPRLPAIVHPSLLLGGLVLLNAALGTAAADQPLVTIDGGVQHTNQQVYAWKVANRHSSPIVFIEFPHYHGDTFLPPAGWTNEWKNRTMLGGKDAPGWVRTSVADPTKGIPPGRSAEFTMRIARDGALARPGNVTVRFADGRELTVAGVELPSAKSFLETNVMGFGLALIFAIGLLIHFLRRRKQPPAAESPPAAARTEE